MLTMKGGGVSPPGFFEWIRADCKEIYLKSYLLCQLHSLLSILHSYTLGQEAEQRPLLNFAEYCSSLLL